MSFNFSVAELCEQNCVNKKISKISLSGSQVAFKWSIFRLCFVYVHYTFEAKLRITDCVCVHLSLPEFSPDDMFLTSGPFVTKHSTVLHHYLSGLVRKNFLCYFQHQGQTEDMAVCTLSAISG